MNYCPKCQMKVENQLSTCPLCGHELIVLAIKGSRDYPERFAKGRRFPRRRLILFIALVIILSSFMSGVFQDFKWSWVIIISVSTIYLTISALLGSRVKRSIGPNLLMQVIGVSCVAFVIDYFVGYRGWALDIVFPLALAVGTTVITVMILFDREKFTDLVIYQLVFGAMGLLIAIFIYFHLIIYRPVAIIGSYYTVMTCVALFFFADRRIIHELKKKFHY